MVYFLCKCFKLSIAQPISHSTNAKHFDGKDCESRKWRQTFKMMTFQIKNAVPLTHCTVLCGMKFYETKPYHFLTSLRSFHLEMYSSQIATIQYMEEINMTSCSIIWLVFWPVLFFKPVWKRELSQKDSFSSKCS